MTTSKIEIIPSILTDDPDFLKERLDEANDVCERVHIDIIDGVYADNKTVPPESMLNLDHLIRWDFHLMVNNPVHWVNKCASSGADRIIAQIEMMSNQREFIEKVLKTGSEVGLALDIGSGPDLIDKEILDSLDVILVMSVPAGFGGQKFHNEALNVIDELDQIRKENGYRYKIADDGGITYEFVDDVKREGADQAIIGNRLFNGGLAKNIVAFQKAA